MLPQDRRSVMESTVKIVLYMVYFFVFSGQKYKKSMNSDAFTDFAAVLSCWEAMLEKCFLWQEFFYWVYFRKID